MKLNVKLFATLKEKAQTTHLIVDLEYPRLTVPYGICWLNLSAKNQFSNRQ